MKQNPITTFDAGFFKEAEALGMDVHFLKGLVAENNEAVQKWSAAFDEIEQQTGDKHFRFKVAGELAELLKDRPATPMQKQANEMLQQILQWAQENPELTGGGIGGLLGLLLGHSAGHPLMGLMMGGLGGAGLGHYGKLQNWWGGGAGPSAVTPVSPPGDPADPSGELAREEESTGGTQMNSSQSAIPPYSDPEADLRDQGQVPDPREANADKTVMDRLNRGLITQEDVARYNLARKKIDLSAAQAGERRIGNQLDDQLEGSLVDWRYNFGNNASRVADKYVGAPLRNAGQLAGATVDNMVDTVGNGVNTASSTAEQAVRAAGQAIDAGVQTAKQLPSVINETNSERVNPVKSVQPAPQVRPPLAMPSSKPTVPLAPNNRPVVPPQAPGTNHFAPSFQR